MKKYFQVNVYSRNMKERLAIFDLNARDSIQWEHLRKVKGIEERNIGWKRFRKYFKQKYLSNRYYDNKMQELYELKLGQTSMEEHVNKFIELIRYVDYIRDQQVKIQRFLSGLPQTYKDRIRFMELKTLDESIRKVRHFSQKNKGKSEVHQAWKDKPKESLVKERRD